MKLFHRNTELFGAPTISVTSATCMKCLVLGGLKLDAVFQMLPKVTVNITHTCSFLLQLVLYTRCVFLQNLNIWDFCVSGYLGWKLARAKALQGQRNWNQHHKKQGKWFMWQLCMHFHFYTASVYSHNFENNIIGKLSIKKSRLLYFILLDIVFKMLVVHF